MLARHSTSSIPLVDGAAPAVLRPAVNGGRGLARALHSGTGRGEPSPSGGAVDWIPRMASDE